jgi:hypothetical protein
MLCISYMMVAIMEDIATFEIVTTSMTSAKSNVPTLITWQCSHMWHE